MLTDDNIDYLKSIVFSWRGEINKKSNYKDIEGFCKSVDLSEIKNKNFELSPGFYVGNNYSSKTRKDNNKDVKSLTEQLENLQVEGNEIDNEINTIIKSLKL